MNKRSNIRPAVLLFGLVISMFAASGVWALAGSGAASIAPSLTVAAGSAGTWTITYAAADTFIAGTIEIAIPDGWSAPQISNPAAAGFVTASSMGTLGAPALSIDGRSIVVSVAALDTNQTVDVVYGDASIDQGGAAVAQTGPESGVQFLVRSDSNGPGRTPIASSPLIDVAAASAAQLVFLTLPRIFPADGESGAIGLATRDEFGNPSPVESDLRIHLASSAPTGRFSASSGAGFSETDTVTIAAGTDTVSFYYRDAEAGVKTITVSAAGQGWSDPQQTVTVEPGEPFRLRAVPADTLAIAGEYVRYRLRIEDVLGNPSAASSSQTISLFGQPGSFYMIADHTTPISQIVIPAGASSVSLDYRNTVKALATPYLLGFFDQDGTPPTLEAASAAIYIDHASFSPTASDVGSTDPLAVADGVDPVPLIAYVRDAFFNGVDGAAVVFEATGSGNSISQPVGVTGSDGRANGAMTSTVAGEKIVTARTGGVYIDHNVVATFGVGPFDPSVSDIAADKSAATADGVDSIAAMVTVRDAQGNAIAGSVVTLECTGSGNTIRQPAGVTGVDGVARGSVVSTTAEAKTIRARANGVYLTEQVAVSFTAGPFDENLSDLEVDKASIVADNVDSVLVTVTVRDAQGNAIAGSVVTLECTGSGNTIRQPVGLAGADGRATGGVKSTVAEAKTIRARVDGTLVAAVAAVSFVAGPFDPDASEIHVDRENIVADGADAVFVTVYVRDADANPIAGAIVAVECSGSGNAITQPVGVTLADGRAVGSVKSTVAEIKNIRARAGGVLLDDIVPVAFSAGALHHFIVAHAGSATAGVPASVTVDARDANNNKLTLFTGAVRVYPLRAAAADEATWGLGNAAGSIVSEVQDTVTYQFVFADAGDAELLITDRKVESVTIGASSGGVISVSAAPLVVGPAAADSVFVVSGNGQRAVVDTPVPLPLVVAVEDRFGNRVSGVTVSFAVTSGGGYIDTSVPLPGQQTTAITGSQGTASCEYWRLGTASGAGVNAVTASISTGGTREAFFTATADHGPVASIVLSPASKPVTVNTETIVMATLRDGFGNLVFGQYVTIFIKDTPDGFLGAAPGSTTEELSLWMRRGMSDSTGTVSVAYHAPAVAGAQDVIDAYHNSIPAADVVDAVYSTVSSGATDLRATLLSGPTSQAGVTFSFIVEAVDGNGNRDLSNTSHIVLEPPPGGGFAFSLVDFGVTTTEADLSAGAVVIYGRGTLAGSWQIGARDAATFLAPAQCAIEIVANETVSSYAVAAPATATAGAGFAVTAEARDAFGNRVLSAGYNIDFRAVRASDSTQAASRALSVAGGALVNGFYSGGNFRYEAAEPIRIEVTSASNAVAGFSGAIAVDNAAAYLLAKIGGDSAGVAAGDSLRLRARVFDAFGNAVDGQNVFFTVQEGGGRVSSPLGVTDASGAAWVWFRTDTQRGTNRARAAILDANPEELETRNYTVATIPRSEIDRVELALSGASFMAGEVFAGNIAAYDIYGNLIDTDSHTQLRPAALRASVDFNPDILTLDAGRSSFAAFDSIAGANRIEILSLGGDTLSAPGASFTIAPAQAYRISEISGDTAGVTVGAAVELRVRVRDRYGNAVAGEIVRFQITSALGGAPMLWDGTGAPNDGIVLTGTGGAVSCFLVTDSNAGLNTVTASILDADPPSLEQVVFAVGTIAGTIARFDVIPDGFAKKAGESFSVQIVAYDLNGNVAEDDDTTRVDLGSNGSAAFAANPVVLAGGRATANASDTVAERLVLRARTLAGGATSYSDTIVVSPEVPSGIIAVASVNPDTITANGTSVSSITTQPIRDMYGNIVSPGTLVRVTPSLGSVGSDDQDPSTPDTKERRTEASGAVSVFIRSASSPGTSNVAFQSLSGSAAGSASVIFAPPPLCFYAGYLTPRHLVPTEAAELRCSAANASATGVSLTTATTISFSDSAGHAYEAHLAAPMYLRGVSADTLEFTSVAVPAGMLGGTYTPRVSLVGTDRYGYAYRGEFAAGSNSISISDIDIESVVAEKAILSRGDTFAVDVRVHNGGGSTVAVNDITLSYRNGLYGLSGAWDPALPSNIAPGGVRVFRRSIYVLGYSPLGPDTIDASVTAQANGSQVQDPSAYPNVAAVVIQSAASIGYVAGTLAPDTVSQGQTHSFALSFHNGGQAAVILNAADTRLGFTDGADAVSVSLGFEGALPGNRTTELVFPPVEVPVSMDAGGWPVTVRLRGTENGGHLDTTLVLSDPIRVVSPAALSYRGGTLAPPAVSKRSTVSFEAGVMNAGGATVVCNPDSTRFTFTDGSLTYTASLDASRGRSIGPGSSTLYFRAVAIPAGIAVGSYQPSVRIRGFENGVPFAADLALSDPVGVQEPSQLAITSTTVFPAPLVTADQSAPWFAAVRVQNNGGAAVRLESLAMRLLAGPSDVTNQCVLTPLDFQPNVDSLLGGASREIAVRFEDNPSNTMTTGTIVIESAIAGRDLNSGAPLLATTEYGGKGSYLVQTPASIVFASIAPSADTVTALQTKDWISAVAIRNAGQSDLQIDLSPAATFVSFSTSGDFATIPPAALAGGGSVLEGGATDTLLWRVDRTGSAAGSCFIDATVRATESNSGRAFVAASVAQGVRGTVLVQTPAELGIVGITPLQNPVTISQSRAWNIEMEVRNTGQSDAALLLARVDSTRVAIPEGSGFVIGNPSSLAGGGTILRGGAVGRLVFAVSTTGTAAPGAQEIVGSILAVESNSDRRVFASRAAGGDNVTLQLRPEPAYAAGSLAPTVASSGTSVSFEAAVEAAAGPYATLVLDRGATILSFGDADGDTFRTALSAVSANVLPPAARRTLLFDAGTIDPAVAFGRHPVSLRLVGEENGNPFSRVLPLAPDSILVERAPQLSISRIAAPPSVTRSQTTPWSVRMVLRNNGEASVDLDLSAAKTFLTFTIVGSGDRTYEYVVARPGALAGRGGTVLPGGAIDSLVFTVTGTGSTPGIALVNGTVTGTDVNSNLTVSDDTYSGGFSHVVVELPAEPVVASSTPSRATVTSGQTTAWQIACEVCNAGEADLTLEPDSARVYRDDGVPLAHERPASFVEGGLALPGGACRHLLFSVSPTPALPAGADIVLHARVGFVEDNNGIHRSFDTRLAGSGSGSIRVQSPARLSIALTSCASPRRPYVNDGQRFSVVVAVANGGEARAESIRLALEGSGASAIEDTLVVMDAVAGSGAVSDTFFVTAAGAGNEIFTARLRGAVDANSGQEDLVALVPASDDTALVVIQAPASLAVTAVAPSQGAVNAGQTVEWAVRVRLRNLGEAPLEIDPPAPADLAFSIGGAPVGGYLVVAPVGFASGGSPLVLAGGAADSLVYRIAATGRDTGTVDIAATLDWNDGNDPAAPRAPASGSCSVRVKPPSGLRILSVTSAAPNNARFPNTSIVNTGQTFTVSVRVENTGGDDLDSVLVRLATNGASGTVAAGDSIAYMPLRSERDFVYTVTAAPAPAVEYLRASIVKAVSVNTGEPVTPAEAVESIENLRIELPALLACAASITAPAGAVNDTLSTGQRFVVTAVVGNEGQAAIDTTGRITLVLPAGMSPADPPEPLTKRFDAGVPLTWTIVAPASPSLDTVRAAISSIPDDANLAAPAAIRDAEARIVVLVVPAARIEECAVSVTAPPGAVDGTLSTGQDFVARSSFVPSANADSIWVEIDPPTGFSVASETAKYVGRGTGAAVARDWIVRAPVSAAPVDTIVARVVGIDVNSGERIAPCRAVFAVRVAEKAVLSLSGRISGPAEALDGVVSVNQVFTVEASASKAGDAGIDTAGARIELVLPSDQGYMLDGASETYRKPFYPGEPVAWRIRAPGAPTPPGNLQVRFAEPYAKDVNTNLACAISQGEVFLPVQTEAGAVRMSNVSALDSIPPVVVPQGAAGVPVMRAALRNTSSYTIGLDTVYVAVTDGRGRLVSPPSQRIAALALAAGGARYETAAPGQNPVPIAVGHGFEIGPGAADTILILVDIAENAPPGELRFEIERSADVIVSITLDGGGAGERVGVVNEQGGDIAGSFLSGPLSVMSARFEEYVHNYPNPFRAGSEETRMCYFLTRNTSVSIRIYDLAGSLVWTKEIAAGEPGGTGSPEGILHEVPWNGRNARGEVVRNGVYLCKLEAGSQSALFKIAVAK